jgi:hypothetical protein
MSILSRLVNRILFHPHPYFGFSTQGKNIKRNATFFPERWNRHLIRTKDIISDFLKARPNRSIGVLGAGSLLDIPEAFFQDYSCPIYLQDANPSCISDWEKATKNAKHPDRVHHCLLDITGVLSEWSGILLDAEAKKIDPFLDALISIANSAAPDSSFIKNSTCISLNILSQLPVYWQDFIFTCIQKKFGAAAIVRYEKEILDAVYPSCRLLVKNHLRQLLPEKKNERTLLITDIRYLYVPKNVSPEISRTPEDEFQITYTSHNDTGYIVEEQDALFSVSLDEWNTTLPEKITCTVLDSWLWHMKQDKTTRTFHQVQAIEYCYQ